MNHTIFVLYANSDDFQREKKLEDLLELLPDAIKERAYRYKFPQDAYNFVLGRLLLKKGLQIMGLPDNILDKIQYSKELKPFLPEVHFNISHSLNLVACAISKDTTIGLDIEFPRNIKKENFRHCFNDQEWDKILKDNTLDTFYTYWTQKEAILKVNGMGLNRLMNMEITEGGKSAYFFYDEENQTMFSLDNFKIEGAYCCICSEMMVDIEIKKMEDI